MRRRYLFCVVVLMWLIQTSILDLIHAGEGGLRHDRKHAMSHLMKQKERSAV